MEQKGLRSNNGKLRYDLLEPFAMQELTRVFTFGAGKYQDHNWLKGLKWSNITSSLKRHLAAYEAGEDYDSESNSLHAAHIAWNAMALLSHYRYHPDLDDRNHHYYYTKRIALDIDDVCASWVSEWCKLNNLPTATCWNFQYGISELFDKMRKEGSLDSFYENLPPLIYGKDLPFDPVCYISHRPVSKELTEKWLQKHQFPLKPVYITKEREEKLDVCKNNKIDYFIDDNYETFLLLNKNGICCFLMDTPHNQQHDVGFKRIQNFADFKKRFL